MAKKKSKLAARAAELEAAVEGLFTGTPVAPAKKKKSRAKAKKAKVVKAGVQKAKKTAKKAKKTRKKAKKR